MLPEQETATATPVIVPTFDVTGTTAIHLSSFTAIPHSMGSELRWETLAEGGTSGYEIWRAPEQIRSSAVRISEQIITSSGSPSTGAAYTYIDINVEPGMTYTYWLVEVVRSGATHDAGFTTGWAATQWLDLPIIMQ